MAFIDYFRPVPTLSAEKVRELLNSKSPEEVNLLDVRQPGEYEQGHLPGAELTPVGALNAHLTKLDPDKPTFTY